MVICDVPFGITVTLTSDLVLRIYRGRPISPILFELGIPNLMWQSVIYQVLSHCDLDLFSRIIM